MIRIAVLVTVAILAASGHAMTAERPNVLVILTDDMRWDAMGVVQKEQGKAALFPWFKTPNLDRLASEGTRFTNVFCTTSLCSPSRASFLSGQYAHRHKVLNNFTDFPNDLPSYPAGLRAAGYETAYIGKWHMGEDDDRKRPGFDFWMSHKGQGNYFDTEFNVDGTRKVVKGYYTTVVTDAATDWINRKHEKPWLLVLGHKAPHGGPIVPEPKYEKAFDSETITKPANAEAYTTASGKPAWLKESLPTWHGLGGPLYGQKDYNKFVRAYLGTIASVDDSVGRLYQTLKDAGQLDNTLIVFTTDNGFAIGDHGRVDKRTAYEESIRLPMLVRYPPLAKAGAMVNEMALSLDLAPTILDICGAKPLPNADGRSWKPLLEGKAAGWRSAFFYQYNYEAQFPYTPNVRAVRTADWKYIHYPHGDGTPDRHTTELYNLKDDPLETKNLVADPAYAAQKRELAVLLEKLMKDHGALPDKMPIDEGIKNVLPKF
ncbi:sulfatase family protein [Zavarzinella formosa]|uniref:sulfatase family protein n=1 Tax=Zavarzinella formosa TaxID=360055 RepID=UPI0003145DA8|nr:sulfatase [Zavarzinella formosa]